MNPINDASMCSRKRNTTLAHLALALLCAPFWACSGGASSPSSPTPVAVATPQPCAQTVLFQESGEIPASALGELPIVTTSAGRLDLTADWTFATNQIGLYVVQGACTLDQFNARACNFLLRLETGSKPLKGSVSVQAGRYTVLLANFGSRDDSGAVQIVLSTGACPAVAAASSPPGNTPRQVQRLQPFRP